MESELIKAIEEKCSIETFQKFISDVKNVNLKNRSGETALHVVIRKWSERRPRKGVDSKEVESNIVQAVQLLIDAGADVNLKNSDGQSVIKALISCYEGEKLFKILEILIKAGADDVNSKNKYGKTLLHLAAEDKYNQVDFIRFILNHRLLDVDLQDRNGLTALQCAVQKQNKKVVECLIDAGADISRETPNGYSVLHLAAKVINVELIKYFIIRGLDVNAKSKKGETPLHCLIQSYHSFFKNDELLLLADGLEVLLSANADVNAIDLTCGDPPIFAFLYNHFQINRGVGSYARVTESIFKVLKIFITHGADLKLENKYDSSTPLDIFLKNCYYFEYFNHPIVLLRNFIKYGIMNVDRLFTPIEEGATILQKSCTELNYKMIKFLVNYGANIEVMDENMKTPLLEIIRVYIADNTKDLHYSMKLIDYFLSLNPDINVITSGGNHILNLNPNNDGKNYPMFLWKSLIELIAKKQSTGYLLNDRISQTISWNFEYQKYLDECTEELKSLQELKLSSSRVNLRDFLMIDHRKKLDCYAKDEEFVRELNEFLLTRKYPIYSRHIVKKFSKALKKQEVMEKAAVILSSCLPYYLDPSDLIIRKILSYVEVKYLKYLCEPESEEIKKKIEYEISIDKYYSSYRV